MWFWITDDAEGGTTWLEVNHQTGTLGGQSGAYLNDDTDPYPVELSFDATGESVPAASAVYVLYIYCDIGDPETTGTLHWSDTDPGDTSYQVPIVYSSAPRQLVYSAWANAAPSSFPVEVTNPDGGTQYSVTQPNTSTNAILASYYNAYGDNSHTWAVFDFRQGSIVIDTARILADYPGQVLSSIAIDVPLLLETSATIDWSVLPIRLHAAAGNARRL